MITGTIDLHCDTLMRAVQQQAEEITSMDNTMLDIQRLLQTGAEAQFFAIFLPQKNRLTLPDMDTPPTDETLFSRMKAVFDRTLEKNKGCLAFAGTFDDLENNRRENRISAFLTLENGHILDGRLENLDRFYASGVRLITLTWNDPNVLGMCHSPDPAQMQKGLTAFGREAVERMNELGILVDVSHTSDGVFRDVAQISRRPFLASHSNARALCPHTRNLSDGMLRTLADHGGVAGLNFEVSFLNSDPTAAWSRIERIVDHAEHMIRVGGEECVALGSDFDGIQTNEGLPDYTHLPLLFAAMERRGFSDDLIDRIRRGNVRRLLRDTL